jgi:hypothetical protein
MPVTDEQVAALRAQLSGRTEEHQRLFSALSEEDVRTGYRALVSGAFMIAAEQRFGRQTTPAALAEFVAELRAGYESVAAKLDPRTAERVLRAAYTSDRLSDLDPRAVWQARVLLLAGMVSSARLDSQALEDLLSQARKLADQATS